MLLEEVERQTSVPESLLPPDPKNKIKNNKKVKKAPPLPPYVHSHIKVDKKNSRPFYIESKKLGTLLENKICTVFPHIVSALELFPPLNSFRSKQ